MSSEEDISRIKAKLNKQLKIRKDEEYQLKQSLKSNISKVGKEDIDIIFEKLTINKDLTKLLNKDFSFSNSHLSIISHLFNKKISQKYLGALKYYILNDYLEKQTQYNEELLKIISILYEKIIEIQQSNDNLKKQQQTNLDNNV
jgi:hypothetical protein